MDEQEIREFWETHKMKSGKDYRLEVLKLSHENMYDYLDFLHQENIHGWRTMLFNSENTVKRLLAEFERRPQPDNQKP